MPLPKAILWDMDGVLADTNPLHMQIWERVLSEYCIPFNRDRFNEIFGLKSQEFLPLISGRPFAIELIEKIVDQKEMMFRQVMHGNIQPLPGVMDWLRRFKLLGCKQAVASSAPPENIDAVVDELGIHSYFDALVNPGDLPGKPDPAVFLLASRQLRIPAADCLVIEDSIPGIEAARLAGMHTIAIASTNPPEALSQADLVLESLDQLSINQVESLN
jgi:HAD superfamily hydrolase (TIGR01509 family)